MKPGNPYEQGQQKIIPAVLIYAFYQGKVLMLHRNKNPDDFHAGIWNGLGGKLEKGESPLEAAHREFLEESGIDAPLSSFSYAGFLQFPNFKPHKQEDWHCFVFRIDLSDEPGPLIEISEGTLSWIDSHQMTSLKLWEGDRFFIPLVLEKKNFLGTIWYEDGKVKKQEFV